MRPQVDCRSGVEKRGGGQGSGGLMRLRNAGKVWFAGIAPLEFRGYSLAERVDL